MKQTIRQRRILDRVSARQRLDSIDRRRDRGARCLGLIRAYTALVRNLRLEWD